MPSGVVLSARFRASGELGQALLPKHRIGIHLSPLSAEGVLNHHPLPARKGRNLAAFDVGIQESEKRGRRLFENLRLRCSGYEEIR